MGKNLPANEGDTRDMFDLWIEKFPWRRKWQLTPVLLPGKNPRTEEPGRLHSIGLQRVGQDSAQHSTKISTQLQLTPLHTPVLFEYDIHNFANPLMVLTTA